MKTIVGLFRSYDAADQAVTELADAGYGRDNVQIMARETAIEPHRAGVYGDTADSTAEGAVAGAQGGAVLGGLAGLVFGLGALAIPGIGPVVATGTLAATLASTLAGAGIGAATGGVLGALVGMGVPKNEAEIYAEGVRRGGVLVSVAADETEVDEVREILRENGAVDINTQGETWRRQGWRGYDPDSEPTDDLTF